MSVTQTGAVAAGVEAARFSGVQQSGQAASTSAVQRQNNRVAQEAELKKTEVVEDSPEKEAMRSSAERRLDITV